MRFGKVDIENTLADEWRGGDIHVTMYVFLSRLAAPKAVHQPPISRPNRKE